MTEQDHHRLARAHSERFREVSNGYPRMVAAAYGGDIARAMADDDLTVAATMATYEASQGIPPRDWQRIGGEDEGRDEDRAIAERDGGE